MSQTGFTLIGDIADRKESELKRKAEEQERIITAWKRKPMKSSGKMERKRNQQNTPAWNAGSYPV